MVRDPYSRSDPPEGQDLDLLQKLDRARELWGQLDEAQGDLEAAQLACMLQEVLKAIGDTHVQVELWCATKFYRENLEGDPNKRWPPAPWTGHTTKEQAEAYAPAIKQRYLELHHVDYGDQFRVTRQLVSAHSIVPPELSAEDYVRGIG
jgi:hypothetical protein